MHIQATSICLNGRAYLITGDPGIGKSALALALINQGAMLIADDMTVIEGDKALAPKDHTGWLEVRGIGLASGFSVCPQAPVAAVIHLSEEKPERSPQKASVRVGDNNLPLFHLWAQDLHLSEKVFVIDGIISGQLTLE